MVKINWTEQAEVDLKDIYNFIRKNSKRYALLQINKIRRRVIVLKTKPFIGKKVEEYQTDRIREIVEGNYRIIYRLKNNLSIKNRYAY